MYRDSRMSDYEMNEFDYSIADENLEKLEIQGYDVLNFLSWVRNYRYEFINQHEIDEAETRELFQEYVDMRIEDLLDSDKNYDPSKLAKIPFNVVLFDDNGNEFTYLKTQNNN